MMAVFSTRQLNNAHLGMYVGTKGPVVLRQVISDKLFTYQLIRKEETVLQNLNGTLASLVFPDGNPIYSLEKLSDLVLPDICEFVFDIHEKEDNISKSRTAIKDELEGPILHRFMQTRKDDLRKKNNRLKLLSRIQFQNIFPDTGQIDINKLDITALCFIIFEGIRLRPRTDFDKFPRDDVLSIADDTLRIKMCRNFLVHQADAEISDVDFEKYWNCLTDVFERLTGSSNIRHESDMLKVLRLPEEKIETFKAMIQQWRMDEKDDRQENAKQLKEVVKQTGAHTEKVIEETGSKIVQNQNRNHEELKCLIKKDNKEKRQLQRTSFPILVYGHNKFKKVCHMMQKKRIKYTIPNASSTEISDSSSGQQSTDLSNQEYEIDSAEDTNRHPITIRRTKSLPRYRQKFRACVVGKTSDTTNNTYGSSAYRVSTKFDDVICDRTRSSDSSSGDSILQNHRTHSIEQDGTSPDEDATGVSPITEVQNVFLLTSQNHEVDIEDPTGYFQWLQRRDKNTEETTITDQLPSYLKLTTTQADMSEESNSSDAWERSTDLDHLLTTDSPDSEYQNTVSTLSGEYILDHDDIPSLLDFSEMVTPRFPSFRSANSGYITDGMILGGSVEDDRTSTDTMPMFRPIRPPYPIQASIAVSSRTSPMIAFSQETEQNIREWCSRVTTDDLRVTDDGYSSTGYFSSLDRMERRSTRSQARHQVVQTDAVQNPFPHTDNGLSNLVISEEEQSNQPQDDDDTTQEVSRNMPSLTSTKRHRFSISKYLRRWFFCGRGQTEDEPYDSTVVNGGMCNPRSENSGDLRDNVTSSSELKRPNRDNHDRTMTGSIQDMVEVFV